VIGDVAGRGIPAAAVMGRLAATLRACAFDGRPVDAGVACLDELMKELEQSQMTTLFQLSLELSSGSARYVRAGHPPALLRLPDGEVSELSGVGSPPLGGLRGARFVANAITLPAGSTILLYTDGLIERRRLDLQVGIERLKEAFAAAGAPPESIVEEIPRAMGAERVPDDIALLAARFRGAEDQRDLVADN
jgi:serine phosphatase RsbU (regulator of sigma subunit)